MNPKTELTFSLMNYFANSLGVNCVFCHSSRAFYDGSEVTPQWGIAALGRQMVIELNSEYLIPLADILPEERLGQTGLQDLSQRVSTPHARAECHRSLARTRG